MSRNSITMAFVLAASALPGILAAQRTVRDVTGAWNGSLAVPGATVRLVFLVQRDADGKLQTKMDSPDQGATGIPVSETIVSGDSVKFVVAAVGGGFSGKFSADGTQIEGSWSQGANSAPLVLKRGNVAAPKRPQEPKPPLPYTAEGVRFTNREAAIELVGTITLPRSPGPHPVVVLITGSGPQDRDETVAGHRPFLVLADHLTRNGIAVLRYDDRGFGESTGNFATATSNDFAGDALAAVAYLKTRSDIDAKRIGLLGHSEGGLIAPIAAARSRDIAFVVLLAGPGVKGTEILLLQGEKIARAGGTPDRLIQQNQKAQRSLFAIALEERDTAVAANRMRAVMQMFIDSLTAEDRRTLGFTDGAGNSLMETTVRQVNSPWFRYFLSHDPRNNLEHVTVPVLALNGEKDLQVPHEQNLPTIEAALRAGGNRDITIRMLPGLNHLFQTASTGSPTEYAGIEETFAPAALDVISSWITQRFGSAR